MTASSRPLRSRFLRAAYRLLSRSPERRAEPERHAPRIKGDLRVIPGVASRFLTAERDVLVYLPPGYQVETRRRYPVLYMHDGQNLFDPQTSFIPGQDWRLGETFEALLANELVEPLVMVGVYNAGAARVDEYTPTHDVRRKVGGKADAYGRFLVQELKPWVDTHYRTRPGAGDTGLGGSSLGGLVSLYLGLTHPDVYGRVAALSPSVWWDHEAIVRMVSALPRKLPLRLWVDVGTKEEGSHRGVRRLRRALLEKGWRPGADLKYLEERGAGHSEREWARRSGPMLRFLFPPRDEAAEGPRKLAQRLRSAFPSLTAR